MKTTRAVADVRGMQASCLRLHAQSNIHRLALRAYYFPHAEPTVVAEQGREDMLLLQGAPQIPDILRVWRYVRSSLGRTRGSQSTYLLRPRLHSSGRSAMPPFLLRHGCHLSPPQLHPAEGLLTPWIQVRENRRVEPFIRASLSVIGVRR